MAASVAKRKSVMDRRRGNGNLSKNAEQPGGKSGFGGAVGARQPRHQDQLSRQL